MKLGILCSYRTFICSHVDGVEDTTVTFLVNVNNTYKHIPPFDNSSYTCATTVKTDPLSPDTPLNKSEKRG